MRNEIRVDRDNREDKDDKDEDDKARLSLSYFPHYPYFPYLPYKSPSISTTKFVVSRAPSATLGKNPDDGLY